MNYHVGNFLKYLISCLLTTHCKKTQGVYTMRDTGKTIKELTFIVITFVDNCEELLLRKLIQENCDILKLTLNQESILVEVSKPEVMFL